jgi:proteasome lid subunit RPN8/RPN11
MLQALVSRAGLLFDGLTRSLLGKRAEPATPSRPRLAATVPYLPLERVTLTDEVGRTLFEEFASHRAGARGEEETGWVLLGLRQGDEALVLATLPAGADCQAGVAHVRFNSDAQALASRIVRQIDRRLTILGVVHTHPGTLRHPSDGDFRGDRVWVEHLRGGEGVFGIGTIETESEEDALYARQPRPHVQCWGDMRLSWYALRSGDRGYRPLPYALTLGPDLARPLHAVWLAIEAHAEPLDRLYRQQAKVTFEVVKDDRGPALGVEVPLAEPGETVRVLLNDKEVHYFVRHKGDLFRADSKEARVDRGVYLLLAELAGRDT